MLVVAVFQLVGGGCEGTEERTFPALCELEITEGFIGLSCTPVVDALGTDCPTS